MESTFGAIEVKVLIQFTKVFPYKMDNTELERKLEKVVSDRLDEANPDGHIFVQIIESELLESGFN